MPDTGIPLAQVIADLRSELLSALHEGKNKPLRFKLQPVQLELQIAVTRDAEGDGGVKFWVLNFGAKASVGDAVTQTLKLVLEPVTTDGRSEFLVSDLMPEPN